MKKLFLISLVSIMSLISANLFAAPQRYSVQVSCHAYSYDKETKVIGALLSFPEGSNLNGESLKLTPSPSKKAQVTNTSDDTQDSIIVICKRSDTKEPTGSCSSPYMAVDASHSGLKVELPSADEWRLVGDFKRMAFIGFMCTP